MILKKLPSRTIIQLWPVSSRMLKSLALTFLVSFTVFEVFIYCHKEGVMIGVYI